MDVLGFAVCADEPHRILAAIDGLVADPWDGVCRHVVTLNPEYVIAACRHPHFADALRRADLTTSDGAGVLIAARLLGGKATAGMGRVTGVDLCEHLAVGPTSRTSPVFFLGAAPGVAEAAARALRQRVPDSRPIGTWGHGSPDPEDDPEALKRIAAAAARVVLVAYGAPGQVLWIERNRAELAEAGIRLAIGVGGTFDVLSGRVPRAPRIVRRLGLEWLFRLLRQPWRWRRQLALPRFALLVLVASVRHRR